ncbi:MAG: glycosyltransferase family 4 protein [Candidatus Krumholzibacteriia bacterium]
MRVIQANKYHFVKGGADRYYLDLSAAQTRRGYDVVHLTMAHPRNEPLPPNSVLLPEVDYHRPLSGASRIRAAARAVFSGQAYRLAAAQAAAVSPDVVHLHNIYHQISPSIVWAFRRARVPMVMTVHDYKLICPGYVLHAGGRICEECRGGRYHRAIVNRCVLSSRSASAVAALESGLHRLVHTYDHVALFLCPSRFLRDKLADFGVSEQRLRHLPYHLPDGVHVPTPVPESRRCIYVGRLSREKGIRTLLRAFRRLTGIDLCLDILGEGPLRSELEREAAACGPGRVRFHGYLEGAALHDAIRGADFAVLPAEYHENLPYGILEPFALGRPVVASRAGGIPELVRDGVTGRLFAMGDERDLADALAWMASPRADRRAMGRNAIGVIERDHAEPAHLTRLEQFYRDAGATVADAVSSTSRFPVQR